MRKIVFSLVLGLWASMGFATASAAETLVLDIEEAAMAVDGQTGRPVLDIRLEAGSAKTFGDLTVRHLSEVLDVVLDGKILTSPRVQSPILEGSLRITGDFSEAEVEAMAERIASGATFEVRTGTP
ncbi:SecDF P1 head subdomain-containing protein [Pelagibacterium halotolerans]|uniref:SecDF P1 head subdomain domain-containing protein n=1 Tax=Pelagibacterium halotolerans (strain DSM 22347 / JCM 15775 / CGMCC 1.7692 / B2) TaxID=1082931 RepID=G4R8N8_PELHB|nr:hypothetical protein [Pelagibacterium halotolerans]AEQ50324.1 hypothetical protein KKY_279 [Pelagibacterium halotolerans B2]QJR19690.1 hypothetical protein HKM20_15375 [Pelagibacterium halotolerans]SEA53513.1 hypothetical protein SAMN05428936_104355 [Pelagibacterium halotolerans]